MSRMLSNEVTYEFNLAIGQLGSLDILRRLINLNFDKYIKACDKIANLLSYTGPQKNSSLILIIFHFFDILINKRNSCHLDKQTFIFLFERIRNIN
jgi:hypothetical protein